MIEHPRPTAGPSLDVVESPPAESGPDRPHDGRRRWRRLSRRKQIVIGIVLVIAWVIGAIVWHYMGKGVACGCTPAP